MSQTEQIGATIPTEVAEALRASAQANERSFSAEVRLALRRHVGADSGLERVTPAEPTTDLPEVA